MLRSIAVRAVVAIAMVAAISCCSAVSRAETLSPLGSASAPSQGLLGSLGGLPAESVTEVSAAVLRSVASESESVSPHSAAASPSFGSQVVRTAPGMGFGFEKVPFESFLTVAAAPNGKNVVRTFIILEPEASEPADASLGKSSVDDLVNKYTRASVGSTTTSGSATLSILQVSPASSSLVFTNVLLKDGSQVTE
jgi:hypothetical protein